MRKIRVLIVDDSASVRTTLSSIIASDPALEVMATAADAYAAAERMRSEIPDVMFLDIELPRMDGLTFLRRIMAQRPIPVVICSSHTHDGSDLMIAALEAGAVDVIAKPRVDTARLLQEASISICDVARGAAHARVRNVRRTAPQVPVESKLSADVLIPPLSESRARTLRGTLPKTEPVICLGASTGGTEALAVVLKAMPRDVPGIVVVQHMPENFTAAFARRLDGLCAIDVKEAEDGDEVRAGRALIAPGNRHMMLHRTGRHYTVRVVDGPLVSRHRPSVDVLFRSAAQQAAGNAVAAILTGMGDDGARGLLEMREMGAFTVAQDEATCVVFGMPKEAIERGGAVAVLPLQRVARELVARAKTGERLETQP